MYFLINTETKELAATFTDQPRPGLYSVVVPWMFVLAPTLEMALDAVDQMQRGR